MRRRMKFGVSESSYRRNAQTPSLATLVSVGILLRDLLDNFSDGMRDIHKPCYKYKLQCIS